MHLSRNLLIYTCLIALSNTLIAEELTVKYNFIAIPSINGKGQPLIISGRFTRPNISAATPAVIIVHGSGGVDERGPIYRKALNQQGIATFELDMWAARGLSGGLSRPKHVKETLPDIYSSIRYLQQRSDIMSENIGLIGFSWGGVIAMLMSGEQEKGNGLKALVANYPICWAYNKLAGYPFKQLRAEADLLIISGKEDRYDAPNDCEKLVSTLPETQQSQVTLLELDNATHAFELPRYEGSFYDPFAYQGRGGDVPIRYNPIATQQALTTASLFFKINLQ